MDYRIGIARLLARGGKSSTFILLPTPLPPPPPTAFQKHPCETLVREPARVVRSKTLEANQERHRHQPNNQECQPVSAQRRLLQGRHLHRKIACC